MFIEERHRTILELLTQEGSITTSEIKARFGISYDSAKRDLRILEEKGLLRRTHGGAIIKCNVGWDGQFDKQLGKECKKTVEDHYLAIAKRAIAEIKWREVVFVTAGDIGYRMAQNMTNNQIFTVVTNSAEVASELHKKENITAILVGGEMRTDNSFYDGFSSGIIERLHFDKCFITSGDISSEFGFFVQGSHNTEWINRIIQNSGKVYGLYSAEKSGKSEVICNCDIEKLDVLVTDKDLCKKELKTFREAGVEVIVARS
ncbi:MAG: DeoR/GlpR family DNA-binding transcription regulator [Lachnospiraceae bacterium]|nr:DeoR/GlpR family DNA-binding transcription regulator [Lachnospiraceae bacterium]